MRFKNMGLLTGIMVKVEGEEHGAKCVIYV
jgi:hypothetical protein